MKKIDLENVGKRGVIAVAIGATLVGGVFGGAIAPNCSLEHDKEIAVLKTEIKDGESSINKKNDEVKKLKEEVATLDAKVKDAQPWFTMSQEEQRKIDEENKRVAEEKRLKEEQEKKRKEEEERVAKENAEKMKYETGITFNQLARTPDEYKGKKVKFKGKVVQTLESDGVVQVRLAVDGSYDKMVLATYSASLVSSRILEDDYITIFGTSLGVMTYESTMGKKITIPSILIEKINQ